MHPADIAELCDMLNVDDARLIYHQLDNETQLTSWSKWR